MSSLKILVSPAHYYLTDDPVSEPRYAYCIIRGIAKNLPQTIDVIVGNAHLNQALPQNVNLITIYKSRSQHPAIELIKYLLFYPLVCLKYLQLGQKYDIVHHMFPTSPHTVDPLLWLIKLTSPTTKIIIGPLQLLSQLSSPQDLSLMLIGKSHTSFLSSLLPHFYRLLMTLTKPLADLTFNLSDIIVCNFHLIKDHYQHIYPKTPIVVIPTGVDGISPTPASTKTRPLTIICVGWLMSHKGQQYLLEAFRLLTAKITHSQLILIGDGHLRSEYEHLVRTHNLSSKVIFTGSIPNSQVFSWYAKSDIYCLPSLIDTNPVVVQEAMSAGLPIVATNVGAVPEIVDSAGITVAEANSVELFQALFKLASNPKLRRQMSQFSLNRIRQLYNWPSIASQWVKLYSDLTK